jgi:Tfp pilus assembly protein FimT
MVLVVTLIVLVVALSAPAYQSWSRGQRLRQGVDNVWALWVKGRARALKEGRPYRFISMLGTNQYRLAPDSVAYWPDQTAAGSLPPAAAPGQGQGGLMVQSVLPAGVQFLPGGHVAPDRILFMPDGTARIFAADGSERPETQLLISDGRGQVKVLHLRGITGVVTALSVRTQR